MQEILKIHGNANFVAKILFTCDRSALIRIFSSIGRNFTLISNIGSIGSNFCCFPQKQQNPQEFSHILAFLAVTAKIISRNSRKFSYGHSFITKRNIGFNCFILEIVFIPRILITFNSERCIVFRL